jgi:hypothetical protein
MMDGGIDRIPARRTRKVKGVHCHTSTIMTESRARVGSPKNDGDLRPMRFKISGIGPTVPSRRSRHMKAAATEGMKIGMIIVPAKRLFHLVSFIAT